MSELHADLTSLAYLVAAVLFIMALRGLSSPESSRAGNYFGMLGMFIAVVTTVLSPEVESYSWILAALALGAVIGVIIARRIAMTAMPQLVAGFQDRKSTRLNSSHVAISYAVFCLKKKKNKNMTN